MMWHMMTSRETCGEATGGGVSARAARGVRLWKSSKALSTLGTRGRDPALTGTEGPQKPGGGIGADSDRWLEPTNIACGRMCTLPKKTTAKKDYRMFLFPATSGVGEMKMGRMRGII